MIVLPNGCRASGIKVSPANWKSNRATTKKPWRIFYRFYDPTNTDARGKVKPKLVEVKGMNRISDLKERQQVTQALIDNELDLLKNKGFNPWTNQTVAEEVINYEIDPDTPILPALKAAYSRLNKAESTMSDIRSVLKLTREAAEQLRLTGLKISEVKLRHIKMMLEHLLATRESFTGNRYNKMRSYLSILFRELKQCEAVTSNPLADLDKKKTVKTKREILTEKQRELVDTHLYNEQYNFWRVMHLFYHLGARETEFMAIQRCHVDLENQRVKVLVKKTGNNYEWVHKTIKTIVLHLWQEICSEAKNTTDFLFSRGLKPGIKRIRTDQITRRWRRHVKIKLGITADFYPLKHLNTTEMSEEYTDQEIAAMNSHKSTAMVVKIYDVRRTEKIHERIKGATNSFVKEKTGS